MSTVDASRDRSALECLVHSVLGQARGEYLLAVLQRDRRLSAGGMNADRATLAMALNVLLLSDLLDRVPTAAAYVAQVAASGGRVCFDHGALRTIDGPCGALPRGIAAFSRILVPLGYRAAGVYPLPKLRMTGHAFVHSDQPETVPQFFVSALHVSELPDTAQAAAARVFGSSVDPLGDSEIGFLAALSERGSCLVDDAVRALPGLAAAFGRHHAMPRLADYETLVAHSAEAAWIATEGNAFNHSTDRVDDVATLAARLKEAGLPLKSELEVSATGRVIQTAFIADRIEREFVASDGAVVRREVPGSFYEFITRHRDPATGKIDLSFDSGNATGIFAVTGAA
jgi:hypothetical protein